VQKNSLSRWLQTAIRGAYQWAAKNRSLTGTHYHALMSTRPHEVRAWSSTIGASSGVPMKQLLQAAYWRSEDIFINHYLRDSARVRGDGSLGIGACVAAQNVCTSLRAYHSRH
jgi:hypothetical protein